MVKWTLRCGPQRRSRSGSESSKGRHTTEINAFELREKRKELNYTLEELAKQIGVSKKAMYEIENRRVNPQADTVKKLETI